MSRELTDEELAKIWDEAQVVHQWSDEPEIPAMRAAIAADRAKRDICSYQKGDGFQIWGDKKSIERASAALHAALPVQQAHTHTPDCYTYGCAWMTAQQAPEWVRLPTTEDEAVAKVVTGEAWLREHAPHRLRVQQALVPDFWAVVEPSGFVNYTAQYPEACHEHINDAINEFGIDEAAQWRVRPAYFAAAAPTPPGEAE